MSTDGSSSPPVRNIMLTIAYEGTAYRGWQVQPNGLTVQQCVETAVERLIGEPVRVLCAGRTDSGVHAVGQVASFPTRSRIPAESFRLALQRFLPRDIVIVRSQEVSLDFHATYSAIRKRYRYLIFDGNVPMPFLNHLVTYFRGPLDIDAIRSALPALLGTHDFRCFETQFPNKSSSIRTVQDVTIQRLPQWSVWSSLSVAPGTALPEPAADEDIDLRMRHSDLKAAASPVICFEIMADGFLYNMVRAIVGTLIPIGLRRKPPEHLAHVISSMDRSQAGSTAPPEGLYLLQVDYPAHLLQPEQSV
ncbi:MAG: tRNA pseudouridine(38-40) synthase TruA [Planctomycetaceae bacterium]